MPLKSEVSDVTQLSTIEFNHATPSVAHFTLPGSEYQLEVHAHAPGVYRLRCGLSKHLNPEKIRPREQERNELLLARDTPVGELTVSSQLGTSTPVWRVHQGDLTLTICQSPFAMALYQDDQCLFETVADTPLAALTVENAASWRFSLSLEPEEALHGLGDSQTVLDRRGQTLVSDQVEQRVLPLLWSTRGWGLTVNSAGRLIHDLGASQSSVYQVDIVDNKVCDLFVFAGDPTEIINQYTALTGRPGQSGLHPLGVWLDQAAGEAIEETVARIEELREQGFSVDAIQMAPPAPFGFQDDKNNVEWEADRVADYRSFFADTAEKEIPIMAPGLPAVREGTLLFEDWEDRGWLLINDDGDAQVFEGNRVTNGQPYGLLDLTHKDAYRLWTDRIRQLTDEGLTAVNCSVQVDIPDDVTARGGESGPVLRTLYPALARKALFDAIAGHKTPQEGLICSHDVFPGAQRYAWQIGPEVTNDWEGLERTLRSALAVGDSGITLQTHQLGNPLADLSDMTPELYIRWLAMCVFSGNFHLQGIPELLPTAFDEETQALAKHWLEWRYRLIPYVLGIIEDGVRTGLPVQRSMAQAFPHDPMAQAWDTQYLFGPALLIAPVLKPGVATQIYLPEGDDWWDVSTGWRYEGGTTLTLDAPLNTLPVFGRDGHILSLGPSATHTGDFNSARILEEVWMFGMPQHSPVVMRNRIRVMQMQGSSYIKGLEGLRILPSEGLEVKRRGAEVRISPAR